MKAVILKHREWDRIFKQIKEDYKDTPATFLIRGRMKTDLGFTVREHREYTPYEMGYDPNHDYRDDASQIHIDFYSEEARTFFVLRYLNRDES